MKKRTILYLALALLALTCLGLTTYVTNAGGLTHVAVTVPLTETQKGATAPTKTNKGTTPTVQGLLFDAANELMQLQLHIPDQYVAGTDIDVNLYVALNQLEVISDVIDWTMDYVVTTPGVDGVDKTSTNKTSDTAIVSGGVADETMYRCVFTLVYNDANNRNIFHFIKSLRYIIRQIRY